MQKGSHPSRSQRLEGPPSAPAPPPAPAVAPPGDPAPGAPGGRWLKRAGDSREPPLRAANDRRPPGPGRKGAWRPRLAAEAGLEFRGSQEEEEGPSGPPPGQAPPKAPPPLTASVSRLHGGRDGCLPSWG